MQETWAQSLVQKDPLEKEMATHSHILAGKIPWTEEAGGLQSLWSQRVGHDWATNTQTGDGKGECWHFRNQWTKTDRNGWTIIDLYMVDDHYTYFWGQESLRRKIVALIVNKRVQNAVLGCNLKRMISVHFQGKPLNITVLQVYAPTSNAKEAEVEWFYEDLQDLELTP